MSFIEEQRILFITFYNSFESYKEENPTSLISRENYESYFSTGSKIEKLLVEDTARILMVFTNIEIVSVVLEVNGEQFDVNVNREVLNSLTNFKIEDLSADNGTWQESFVRVYTSGIKNAKRKKLLEHFKVQK